MNIVDDCCCSSGCDAITWRCPACSEVGHFVPFATVDSLLTDTARKNLKDDHFFVCLTSDCDIVYFSHDTVFSQMDIVVPVAWKDEAQPKFVCYCNRVTEDEILQAVVHDGAETMQDIARLTGAMKNGKCLKNNPKGVCCHKDIETVLQRALEFHSGE